MKKLFPLVLCLLFTSSALATPSLLYQGHGSLRITTADNKVIYIDPYAGDGYDLPADLILVSHSHPDHNAVDLIKFTRTGTLGKGADRCDFYIRKV